ncbi:MAG TPA: DUF2723 domain-containing protein [Candidatus Limnocylindria bacterium]|nr:DUF2723 domain-containing protein [Candidatus Limnocylindria bacterium]
MRGAPLLAGLFVFFPLLALYARTMLPGLGFWDTAEFQTVGTVLGIAHPTGYPSYTLLAWLASVLLQPFGEPALRANLLSGLLAGGGAALVAATVTLLVRRAAIGVAAGLALGLSGPAWSIGLRADAHALHLALVALVLLLLVGWQQSERDSRLADSLLLAAAVVFGVSLGNHGLTVLLAPGIALFLLAARPRLLFERPRLVLGCALALGLTTVLLYAYLPLRSAMDPPLDYANPQTWEGFSYLVFAEQFRGSFRGFPAPVEATRFVLGESVAEMGAFAALAAVGVLVLLRRPPLLLMLLVWIVLNWGFALGYVNADIERYYLAPLLSLAVLGGVGAAAVLEAGVQAWRRVRDRWRGRPLPVRAARLNSNGLHVAGALALAGLLVLPSLAAMPGRFGRVDLSHDNSARDWLANVLPQLDEGALVISWWAFSTPLWYAQYVDGQRPDIFVADDRTMIDLQLGDALEVIDDNLGRRPVYLIRLPYDLPAFRERYQLARLDVPGWGPDGWVYRVEAMRAGG